jgi:hypothetical protein
VCGGEAAVAEQLLDLADVLAGVAQGLWKKRIKA